MSARTAEGTHASVNTAGIYARIGNRIAGNPARFLEEPMGFSWKKHTISGIRPSTAHTHTAKLPTRPCLSYFQVLSPEGLRDPLRYLRVHLEIQGLRRERTIDPRLVEGILQGRMHLVKHPARIPV